MIKYTKITINGIEHYECNITWQPVGLELFLVNTMRMPRTSFDLHLLPNEHFKLVPRNLYHPYNYRLIFKNEIDAERFSLVADPIRI